MIETLRNRCCFATRRLCRIGRTAGKICIQVGPANRMVLVLCHGAPLSKALAHRRTAIAISDWRRLVCTRGCQGDEACGRVRNRYDTSPSSAGRTVNPSTGWYRSGSLHHGVDTASWCRRMPKVHIAQRRFLDYGAAPSKATVHGDAIIREGLHHNVNAASWCQRMAHQVSGIDRRSSIPLLGAGVASLSTRGTERDRLPGLGPKPRAARLGQLRVQ
jgi:hypothetical protein